MGVLNQAFDVLVLRYGVQKRVYCNVSAGLLGESGCSGLIQDALDPEGRRDVLGPRGVRMGGQREHQAVSTQHTSYLPVPVSAASLLHFSSICCGLGRGTALVRLTSRQDGSLGQEPPSLSTWRW